MVELVTLVVKVVIQVALRGTAGTANKGGGGGGSAAGPATGGAGGSGVVIVRGPSTVSFGVTPGGAITTLPGPAGSFKVATFTASGTLTVA